MDAAFIFAGRTSKTWIVDCIGVAIAICHCRVGSKAVKSTVIEKSRQTDQTRENASASLRRGKGATTPAQRARRQQTGVPRKDQPINYAQNRASFRSAEIRILDLTGNVE
jgi:hypothetical protein